MKKILFQIVFLIFFQKKTCFSKVFFQKNFFFQQVFFFQKQFFLFLMHNSFFFKKAIFKIFVFKHIFFSNKSFFQKKKKVFKQKSFLLIKISEGFCLTLVKNRQNREHRKKSGYRKKLSSDWQEEEH